MLNFHFTESKMKFGVSTKFCFWNFSKILWHPKLKKIFRVNFWFLVRFFPKFFFLISQESSLKSANHLRSSFILVHGLEVDEEPKFFRCCPELIKTEVPEINFDVLPHNFCNHRRSMTNEKYHSVQGSTARNWSKIQRKPRTVPGPTKFWNCWWLVDPWFSLVHYSWQDWLFIPTDIPTTYWRPI